MAHYDYFVAHLQCSHCGAISPADHSTGMQTSIRDPPLGAGVGVYFGVGNPLGRDDGHVGSSDDYYDDSEYDVIHDPDWTEQVRILQSWTCPSCRSLDNWAVIGIRHRVIESIGPTRLTRDVFDRCHYIERLDAESLALRLTGLSWKDLKDSGADLVQILREKLQ